MQSGSHQIDDCHLHDAVMNDQIENTATYQLMSAKAKSRILEAGAASKIVFRIKKALYLTGGGASHGASHDASHSLSCDFHWLRNPEAFPFWPTLLPLLFGSPHQSSRLCLVRFHAYGPMDELHQLHARPNLLGCEGMRWTYRECGISLQFLNLLAVWLLVMLIRFFSARRHSTSISTYVLLLSFKSVDKRALVLCGEEQISGIP